MKYARKLFFIAALLMVGAGCMPAAPATRLEKVTRDMMPKDVPIMAGLEPRDESSWRITTEEGGKRRLESRWETGELYDQVSAWYSATFKAQHLSTHTIENAEGIRIFWGAAEETYYADAKTAASIFVHKPKEGEKTQVDMDVYLP